jgi:IPT/TIG domain
MLGTQAKRAPFVRTEPISGKVGTAVKILGTNLTGATSVSFNGAAAVFKVVSGSLITTAVPVGATTGKVRVVTAPPSGTLASNGFFWVLR